VPVEPATPADVHATLGSLLARMGRTDEARAQLQHALTFDADAPAAHAALGLMLLQADDEAGAMTHLERASQHAEASYLTQFYFAQGLERQRAEATDEAQATAIAARMETALRRAIDLRPGFANAYHLLAHLKSRHADTTDEAVALMAQALQLAPGREDYQLFIAYLHANRQRFVPAKAIAVRLAAKATDPVVRQQAREMADRIGAYERQKVQFEAAGAAPVDPSAFFAPAERNAEGAARFVPALRDVAAHERRLFGLLLGIDCAADGSVVLQVDAGSGAVQVRAAAFDRIEFITYRTDLEGSIPCGSRARPQVVYVTFTPGEPAPADGIVGDAVAVEFLPDGFVPVDPKR